MKPVLQHSPAAHARRAARTGPATGETAPRAETAPAVRAAAPAAARPAVTRPHALHRAGVAAVTAPVRMARAETGVQENLGRARADESAAVSPAAHHVLTARVPLRIMMGQDPIDFDVQPVIRDGIAIAPIRQIIEHSGGVVIWMPATRTVQATTGTRHIELKIGSRRAWINSELTLMERPAEIRSGRTLVPVRFLQVALDMKALYDPSKGMVYLYRP